MRPMNIVLIGAFVLLPLLAFAAGAKVDFNSASGAAQSVIYALQGRSSGGNFANYPGGQMPS